MLINLYAFVLNKTRQAGRLRLADNDFECPHPGKLPEIKKIKILKKPLICRLKVFT
jgi:hypothetical protein